MNDKIKSEKAKELIDKFYWQGRETFGGSPIILKNIAIDAVILAETEAEEHHAKELQELKDKAVEAHRHICCGNCEYNLDCVIDCDNLNEFTQKLNEK